MSVQYAVVCLDCRVNAPTVGDGGYWGMPRLGAGSQTLHSDGLPSFGHLYEPLHAIGLRLYEFEVFREFLESHQQHRLLLVSDHDDPARMPRSERLVYEDFEEILEDSQYRAHSSAQFEAEEREAERRLGSGEFIWAFYLIACQSCEEEHRAQQPTLLKALDPIALTEDAVRDYLSRIPGLDPDHGWHHRAPELVRPTGSFLTGLSRFLAAHRTHRLYALLEEAADEQDPHAAG